MKQKGGARWFKRMTAGVVLAAYGAGCTHMPSGEKAFDSFETCFASNLGLAAAGGIGVGLLTKSILGNDKGSANAVGAAAGIATAALIAMTAWRKCAAVYSKSEPVAQQPEAQALPAAARRQRKQSLNLDKLEMRVEGTENDPPVPEFSFTFLAEDPAAKDIKARFRHKVEIVRFMAGSDDKLVLADAKGNPMLDTAGKPIPLEAAIRMPRERLQWVTIADEGKDDYVEDVVIQQGRGTFRHKLQVPPRAQMPLPLPVPMRYTLSVEAEHMKSTSTVDFALLDKSARPKRYAGSPAVNSAEGEGAAAAATRSLKDNAFVATHTLKRKAALYDGSGPKRKTIASLNAGTRVKAEESAAGAKPASWVQIETDHGMSGWVPANVLVKVK